MTTIEQAAQYAKDLMKNLIPGLAIKRASETYNVTKSDIAKELKKTRQSKSIKAWIK